MSIRQFKLMGGTSDLDLTVKGGTFLSSPQGLGASRNASFVQVGNSFALAENKTKQGEISCEMVFANYTQYRTFISYCSRDNLVFAYKTPIDTDWFYREVVLVSCDKGEIGDGNVLHCSTKFACKTNWYKETEYSKTSENGATSVSFNLLNHGDTECGYELRLSGGGDTVTSITIMDGFDEVNIISNPFQGALLNSNYYYLNTIDTKAEVYYANPLSDPYRPHAIIPDYTQNYFCKLPKTTDTITVGVSFTGSNALTVRLKVREEYISV